MDLRGEKEWRGAAECHQAERVVQGAHGPSRLAPANAALERLQMLTAGKGWGRGDGSIGDAPAGFHGCGVVQLPGAGQGAALLAEPPWVAPGQDLGTQAFSMSQVWGFRSGTPCSLSAGCKEKASDPLVPRAVELG